MHLLPSSIMSKVLVINRNLIEDRSWTEKKNAKELEKKNNLKEVRKK